MVELVSARLAPATMFTTFKVASISFLTHNIKDVTKTNQKPI